MIKYNSKTWNSIAQHIHRVALTGHLMSHTAHSTQHTADSRCRMYVFRKHEVHCSAYRKRTFPLASSLLSSVLYPVSTCGEGALWTSQTGGKWCNKWQFEHYFCIIKSTIYDPCSSWKHIKYVFNFILYPILLYWTSCAKLHGMLCCTRFRTWHKQLGHWISRNQ